MNPLTILTGDCIETLRQIPAGSVHCCITSPPYWGLRSYGIPPSAWPEITFIPVAGLPPLTIPAQECVLGEESEPWAFVGHLVHVFRLVRSALREDGTLWLNLGDSYNAQPGQRKATDAAGEKQNTNVGAVGIGSRAVESLKPKDLVGIPERAAFALQADGWYWRSKSPWIKRNPMPESSTDRPSSAVEHLMLFAKSQRYYYDAEAVKVASAEPDRQRNDRIGGANGHTVRHSEGGMMNGGSTRSRRNSDAFFASWQGLLDEGDGPLAFVVNPKGYEGAHFATFPPKLVEPCIRAGTSARGCCPKCGAPWERVVDKNSKQEQKEWSGSGRKNGCIAGGGHEGRTGQWTAETNTTGWQPGCKCPASDPVPCRVLDPFGGSGTTGKVALELARHAILCELNPEYTKLIEQRTEVTPGLALA